MPLPPLTCLDFLSFPFPDFFLGPSRALNLPPQNKIITFPLFIIFFLFYFIFLYSLLHLNLLLGL
jgi:hypothetical protein